MPRTTPPSPRRPAFFWQGLLVLLPVAVLAVVGLLSIRQDRALADQQAKETGQSLSGQLAQAVADTLREEVAGFTTANLSFNRDLQVAANRFAGSALAEDGAATRSWRAWQREHPEVQLAAMPLAFSVLGADGRQVSPPDVPRSPVPPAWVTQLNADQYGLWQKARAACARGPAQEAEAALETFLARGPPPEAHANAQFLRLQWQPLTLPTGQFVPGDATPQRSVSPGKAWTDYEAFCRKCGEVPADSGVPLGHLAILRALASLPPGAGWPTGMSQIVATAVQGTPSILTPLLLREAERTASANLPPRTPGETNLLALGEAEAMSQLRHWWGMQERTRAALGVLSQRPLPAPTTNTACAVQAGNLGSFLALIHRESMAELNRRPPGFLFPSEPGITVQLLPAKILERAISLAADRVSLPRYVAAMVELGGERFPVGNRQAHRAEPAALPALLGDVAGQFQALSPAGLHPAAFAVQVYLADAPLFYAHQRQRALWYGGLVFAAAVTALVGLLAARSAFHRQLRLSDLKSSFVASVSHELRAPLASVRLLAESLDRGKVGEEAGRKEYFRLIVQECRRLSALIENVLDFSRIDQGRKRYEFELTDLAALVRQTVGLMQPYAAERQVRLALEVADQPLALVADGKAIQQALVNLVDNAVKHSPPGETVLVALSAVAGANNTPPPAPAAGRPASEPAPENEVAAGQLFLSVADCGPGIPMAEQECIFEPFYRRGSELRRETPGVGIGLSIVKHIVEAHSGRVRVDSTPGKGSRFTIELPAKHDYP